MHHCSADDEWLLRRHDRSLLEDTESAPDDEMDVDVLGVTFGADGSHVSPSELTDDIHDGLGLLSVRCNDTSEILEFLLVTQLFGRRGIADLRHFEQLQNVVRLHSDGTIAWTDDGDQSRPTAAGGMRR